MIELHQVNRIFNQGRPNEFQGLYDIDLDIPRGTITCLQGPSGSGKTTLLSLVGCLARPTSGRITLDGDLLSDLPERFLAQVRRSTFGFVFQRFNLIRGLTVLENILLPAYPLAPEYRALRTRGQELLARFRLEDRERLAVEHLSGGEAQRVAICRALINDPEVLIADEPTANLDSTLSRELMAIVRQLKEEGRTLVMASHDPIVCKDAAIDHLVTMRDGRIISRGGPHGRP